MLRLLKEGHKIARYLDHWIKFSQGLDRLLMTVMGFFIFCHVEACIWYLQANFNEDDPTSWANRDNRILGDNPFEVSFKSDIC